MVLQLGSSNVKISLFANDTIRYLDGTVNQFEIVLLSLPNSLCCLAAPLTGINLKPFIYELANVGKKSRCLTLV